MRCDYRQTCFSLSLWTPLVSPSVLTQYFVPHHSCMKLAIKWFSRMDSTCELWHLQPKLHWHYRWVHVQSNNTCLLWMSVGVFCGCSQTEQASKLQSQHLHLCFLHWSLHNIKYTYEFHHSNSNRTLHRILTTSIVMGKGLEIHTLHTAWGPKEIHLPLECFHTQLHL